MLLQEENAIVCTTIAVLIKRTSRRQPARTTGVAPCRSGAYVGNQALYIEAYHHDFLESAAFLSINNGLLATDFVADSNVDYTT